MAAIDRTDEFVLAVTQAQRDALLHTCDDVVEFAEQEEPILADVRMMPTAAAVADDLALPDATGIYWIVSVPREALVAFLEHQLHRTLDFLGSMHPGPLLRVWQTCVSLLDVMGHELDGSPFDGITCHCPGCDREAELRARLEVDAERATSDEERIALVHQFHADLADGEVWRPRAYTRAPRLDEFRGGSQSASEGRAWLAKETGVDEATVVRWVNGEELPPDAVISWLSGPLGVSVLLLMNWDAPGSEIPEHWRRPIAEDTADRCAKGVPRECESLLKWIEWRLRVDADLGEAESSDVPRLRRLRTAVLDYLSEGA